MENAKVILAGLLAMASSSGIQIPDFPEPKYPKPKLVTRDDLAIMGAARLKRERKNAKRLSEAKG